MPDKVQSQGVQCFYPNYCRSKSRLPQCIGITLSRFTLRWVLHAPCLLPLECMDTDVRTYRHLLAHRHTSIHDLIQANARACICACTHAHVRSRAAHSRVPLQAEQLVPCMCCPLAKQLVPCMHCPQAEQLARWSLHRQTPNIDTWLSEAASRVSSICCLGQVSFISARMAGVLHLSMVH